MTENPDAASGKRGYTARVEQFFAADEDLVVGVLVNAVAASGIESQRSTQIIAWKQELEILKAQLQPSEFHSWNIAIEYNLPRRSKRPDVILLADDLIFVIEFKLGATSHDASARWQVEEYCLNLRDFHAESSGRTIIPVLCASEASSHPFSQLEAQGQTTAISEVLLATRDDLGVLLMKAYKQFHKEDAATIDPLAWYDSRYQPTPTIVEAAVHLYERHGVREISHRYAYNLDRTTEMLIQVIKESRQERRHVICFVTGIPGAGKTLTGLDVVHDPDLRGDSSPAGIFLSGNGPLVKIVREALVTSQTARGRRRKECVHEVSTFIQNVHTFLSHYLSKPNECPHEHVVVFDEAQRAWNGAQMKRKGRATPQKRACCSK
ncbi:MAG: DNA/RNA helicase domain-containing protein [Candidatus Binataceae bacterium]